MRAQPYSSRFLRAVSCCSGGISVKVGLSAAENSTKPCTQLWGGEPPDVQEIVCAHSLQGVTFRPLSHLQSGELGLALVGHLQLGNRIDPAQLVAL